MKVYTVSAFDGIIAQQAQSPIPVSVAGHLAYQKAFDIAAKWTDGAFSVPGPAAFEVAIKEARANLKAADLKDADTQATKGADPDGQ